MKPVITVGAFILLAACRAPTAPVPESNRVTTTNNAGKKMVQANQPINQQFRSLDEYLAHLERTQGPIDGPWYRQIRPGFYEMQTGNLRVLGEEGEVKRVFTRDELEREFGFKK